MSLSYLVQNTLGLTLLAIILHDCLIQKEMENHKFLLQFKCRGCNGNLPGRSHPLGRWTSTIKTVFNVDITTDNANVHPAKICIKCRSIFTRLQSAIASKKEASTSLTMHNFAPHADQCSLCFPTKDYAPPMKKQRGGPGRGKRAALVVSAPAATGAAVDESQPSTSSTGASIDNSQPGAGADNSQPGAGADNSQPGAGADNSQPGACADNSQPGAGADNSQPGAGADNSQPVAGSDNSSSTNMSPSQTLVENFMNMDITDREEALNSLVGQLSIHEKSVVARLLGKSQSAIIQDEANALRGNFKDITKLKNFDLQMYIKKLNPVTKSFLEGACHVGGVNSESSSNAFLFACLFDVIYKIRIPSIVTPLSFMRNLTLYVSQDRKWAAKLNAATCPGGSYTSIIEWLKEQTSRSAPIAPEGDILTVFDNDQVVGKTYTVKPKNSVNMSIITNQAWIILDASGTLQQKQEYMPGKWMGESEGLQQVVHGMIVDNNPKFAEYEQIHRDAQTYFLYTALKEVTAEQVKLMNGVCEDSIDRKVAEAKISRSYVKCLECEDLVPRRKRKCTGCGVDLAEAKKKAADSEQASTKSRSTRQSISHQQAGTAEERYSHVTSNHSGQPTAVKVADPVFCNPNSYDSLIAVLRKLGLDAGIHRYGGQKRHWTVVCCDGLPYHLCLKLIDKMLTCTHCKASFFGEPALRKHHTSSHSDDPSYYREFDWVVLRIGAGHYEMNMVKSFTELNWKPFISDLSSILSFKSPFAQQSAKRCDSHHKAWTVFLSFFLGSLKELVLVYVRECLEEDQPITPQGYMEFAKKKRHIPNFTFVHDQVLVYALAIINLRMGIRRNNSDHVESAKHKFKGMFFGRHHPIYAQIEVHDTLQSLLLPEPVQQQLCNTVSFSVSGDKSKGQDADFLLEEVNKESKSWISRGVPEDSTWLTICRNLDDLKDIKTKVREMSNTTTPSSEGIYRKRNVDVNVEAWRCRLRETEYLQGEDETHTSITGQILHSDLANFKRKAESKRSNRLSTMFLNMPEDPHDVQPVFIDAEEDAHYNGIDIKTIPVIKKMIEEGIQHLIANEDDKDYLLSKYSKTKKKADFVSLYHEIQSLHANQIQEVDAESELD